MGCTPMQMLNAMLRSEWVAHLIKRLAPLGGLQCPTEASALCPSTCPHSLCADGCGMREPKRACYLGSWHAGGVQVRWVRDDTVRQQDQVQLWMR